MGRKWQTFVDQQHEKTRSYPNALWVLFTMMGLLNVFNGVENFDTWFGWLLLLGGVFMLYLAVVYHRWGRKARAEQTTND